MNNDNLQLILDGINLLKVQNEQILKRLDKVETRLDQLEMRLDRVEARLDQLEMRLDRVEARLDRVEARLDALETKFILLEQRLSQVEKVLHNVAVEVIDHHVNISNLVTQEQFSEFKSFNLKFHDDTKGALVRLEQEMASLIASHKEAQKRIVVLEKV